MVASGHTASDLRCYLTRLQSARRARIAPGVGPQTVVTVVPNWNFAADLAQCLDSLAASTYLDHAVIVVDNASSDDSIPYLQQNYPQVTAVALPENRGYAAALNVGIACALAQGAGYVFALNNDTLVPAETIGRLVDVVKQEKDIGVVAPKILNHRHPGTLYSLGDRRSPWLPLPRAYGYGWRDQPGLTDLMEFDYVTGSRCSFPRASFQMSGCSTRASFSFTRIAISAAASAITTTGLSAPQPRRSTTRRTQALGAKTRQKHYESRARNPRSLLPALSSRPARSLTMLGIRMHRGLAIDEVCGHSSRASAALSGGPSRRMARTADPAGIPMAAPALPRSTGTACPTALPAPATDDRLQLLRLRPRTRLVHKLHDWHLKLPGEFTLVQCQVCGLMYVKPRPEWPELLRHYPEVRAVFESVQLIRDSSLRGALWVAASVPRHRTV